jgi:carboxymethylenebutenolidase
MIEFPTDKGPATGYLALPSAEEGPGVLVLHAWWGLNDFMRGVCDRLAGEGFVALAPDLYRGATARTQDEARALRAAAGGASHRIMGAAAYLHALPAVGCRPVGVIGFSMGAHWACWLAQQPRAEIAAVALFYGVRGGSFAGARAAFLCHLAAADPWVSAGTLRRFERSLRTAGLVLTTYTYPGTGHWFFEADRADAYDAAAADLAWQRTVAFLRDRLGGEDGAAPSPGPYPAGAGEGCAGPSVSPAFTRC